MIAPRARPSSARTHVRTSTVSPQSASVENSTSIHMPRPQAEHAAQRTSDNALRQTLLVIGDVWQDDRLAALQHALWQRAAQDLVGSEGSPSISWAGSPHRQPHDLPVSRVRPMKHCWRTPGPETFGNWRTACIVRRSWRSHRMSRKTIWVPSPVVFTSTTPSKPIGYRQRPDVTRLLPVPWGEGSGRLDCTAIESAHRGAHLYRRAGRTGARASVHPATDSRRRPKPRRQLRPYRVVLRHGQAGRRGLARGISVVHRSGSDAPLS